MEHCQFETVGVCTLSDKTKEEQSHRDGGGKLHKLTYLWAKMIVYYIVLLKKVGLMKSEIASV